MERIDEFTLGGKNFIYIDLSNIKNNNIFIDITNNIKKLITKYSEHSVYTITNIDGIIFDTETKDIAVTCFMHTKPYVKYGVIIGFDGIKKIMANAVFKLSGRKNMHFCFSKEEAIAWLLQQE